MSCRKHAHRSLAAGTPRAAGHVLLLGCLSLLPLRPGLAALDSDLRPLAEDSVLSGKLGAVGMVIAGESGPNLSIASGFLISPCHVLTAAHVLARPGQNVKIGMPARFQARGQNIRGLLPPVWGRVVAADPAFRMTEKPPGFDLKAITRDWGLVELDHPLSGIEPIKLVFPGALIAPDAQFSIVGYPFGGRQFSLHAQEHCRNWSSHHGQGVLADVVIADCAVRQGMSGGPLLIEGNPTPLAAGIVVERVEIGRKVMTVAVPSAIFAETVVDEMRNSEVCATGSPFAWPPAGANSEAGAAPADLHRP